MKVDLPRYSLTSSTHPWPFVDSVWWWLCACQRSQLSTYAASRLKEPDRLFDYALVVGLEMDEDLNQCVVHVPFHYPDQVISLTEAAACHYWLTCCMLGNLTGSPTRSS